MIRPLCRSLRDREEGVALITTVLVLLLMSAVLVGFTTVVVSDQRFRLIDRDRARAFYAAHSGLEKLNAELTMLFFRNLSPSDTQIAALGETPPSIEGVMFETGSGLYGVTALPPSRTCENPPCYSPVSSGPYAGLVALKKEYQLDATARTFGGGEAHLSRRLETVAIPVFQFGMFSDVDLSFSAADTFDFGGRVHTNGNLFLAQGGDSSSILYLRDKVTAVKEIVRQRLSNGVSIDESGSTRVVRVAKAPNSYRDLARTEGSVVDRVDGAKNSAWTNLSLSTYNGYIRNGTTGVKPLNLPLITTGGTNADLVKRSVVNEDTTSPARFAERYFSKVSLRILLSDHPEDITSLPTVTADAPIRLDGDWKEPASAPAGYAVDALHPPIARSPGPVVVSTTIASNVSVSTSSNANVPLATPGTDFVPTSFQVQPVSPTAYALLVTKSSTSYVVTCLTKTSTQFTDCGTPYTLPNGGTLSGISGATISAVVPTTSGGQLVSTTQASGTWGTSSWATLSVSSTSAFAPNAIPLTVTQSGTDYVVHCAAKTATAFIGCKPVGSTATSPATVSTMIQTVDGSEQVSTSLANNGWQSPYNVINVTSTLDFAPNTFWVQSSNNTNVLISCGGYSPPNLLTGCYGSASATLSSGATITTAALSDAGTGLIGGYIKAEMQDTGGNWLDVTQELLSYGIADKNIAGRGCDPNPNAILRLQRLRSNAEPSGWPAAAGVTCPVGSSPNSYNASVKSTDYWPNVLFDAREAIYRDTAPSDGKPRLGGVMYYVALDVGNLARWFAGTGAYADASGANAARDGNNGYSVYFSDRRNNYCPSTVTTCPAGSIRETGEYGYEDVVNPNSTSGTPDGVLNEGEDFNASTALETYGQLPSYDGTYNAVPPGALAPLTTTQARPTAGIRSSEALVNRAVLFRRALKLVNGRDLANILTVPGTKGLTIATENPVYIQGDFNANVDGSGGFGTSSNGPHIATSVVADAVTLLSNAWNDMSSFTSPYDTGGRPRSANTYYRVAIISGKGRIFTRPTGAGATFGTDGGAHSFLRFLEGTGSSPDAIRYRGSLATFYYNRQAVAPFKCCGGIVYDVPGARDYTFDIDFLDPSKLPPLTPVFRDINALGFSQETRPGH